MAEETSSLSSDDYSMVQMPGIENGNCEGLKKEVEARESKTRTAENLCQNTMISGSVNESCTSELIVKKLWDINAVLVQQLQAAQSRAAVAERALEQLRSATAPNSVECITHSPTTVASAPAAFDFLSLDNHGQDNALMNLVNYLANELRYCKNELSYTQDRMTAFFEAKNGTDANIQSVQCQSIGCQAEFEQVLPAQNAVHTEEETVEDGNETEEENGYETPPPERASTEKTCPVCAMSGAAMSDEALARHVESHFDDLDDRSCPICHATFAPGACITDRNRHVQAHFTEDHFEREPVSQPSDDNGATMARACPMCELVFSMHVDQSKYESHVQGHFGEYIPSTAATVHGTFI